MNQSIYFAESLEDIYSKTNEGNIEVTQIPLKNAILVLMDHPASITVYQYVSIKPISGSVSVFGYEIKQHSSMKVFSSEKTGFIEVKTETFDRIWKKKEESLNLEQELCNITQSKEKAKNILKKFGNFTVAILVKRLPFPPNLHYLELYYPYVIDFNLFKKKWSTREHYYVPKQHGTPIEFDLEAEKIASEINLCVRSAKLTNNPVPRILVYGPKNTGKSSLLRFLVNKILSVYAAAYYLDTDPGQSEFTPPGLVSLTKLNKPVVGPPFAHQRKPVSMIFTGGISADSSPDMYCKSISRLMDLYIKECNDEPLFVNTMGWVEGLGLHCLQNIMSAVKPTVLLELVNEDEISMFDYRNYLSENGQYFQLRRSFSPNPSHLSAKEMRCMSLLSYFGKCQNVFHGPVHINKIEPYCVSWDKIPVYVFGKIVAPYRMVEAINASIVALCNVPETSVLEFESPQIPKTVEDEPDNECLGYGFVRAVDEKKHILFIVTPLTSTELQRVNAIMKGNVMVPNALFLEQPIYNIPLPFTNEREISTPLEPEEELPDCSLLSLKSVSDAESPSNLSVCGSATSYSKSIKRRAHKLMQRGKRLR